MKLTIIAFAVSSIFLSSFIAHAADDKKSLSIEKMTEQISASKSPSISEQKGAIKTPNSQKVISVPATVKTEIKNKSDLKLISNETKINPFYGLNSDVAYKNKELQNLSLDEQIASKRLAISRINHEIKNVGKPTTVNGMNTSFGQNVSNNTENGFNNAIKGKKVAATKTTKVEQKPIQTSILPVTANVINIPVNEPTLTSIITIDDKHYASIKGRDGATTSIKSGDKYEGSVVIVDENKVMFGNKQLSLSKNAYAYHNPDKQSIGDDKVALGGKPASLFPISSSGNTQLINFPSEVKSAAPN